MASVANRHFQRAITAILASPAAGRPKKAVLPPAASANLRDQ